MNDVPLPYRGPLVSPGHGILARGAGRSVSRATFVEDVRACAHSLPDVAAAVLRPSERYRFMVELCAGLSRGLRVVVAGVAHGDGDREVTRLGGVLPVIGAADSGVDLAARQEVRRCVESGATVVKALDFSRGIAELFTSGSTGEPVGQLKSWANLAACASRYVAALPIPLGAGGTIVATVPPWHMYGLEISVLVPLLYDVALFDGQPTYPGDIREALASVPPPRILVTTPVQLRALVGTTRDTPEVALIVSAAAPLPRILASKAEQVLAAPLHEVYGFTEAGIVATRRPTQTEEWTLASGMRIGGAAPDWNLAAEDFPAPVAFPDLIEPQGRQGFRILGRSQEIVKIGGKRFSLSAIEAAFCEIPGVIDAAVLFDSAEEGREERPIALVVAPTCDVSTILDAVRQRLDPVCVPREVFLVPSLPRSGTSKLQRGELKVLLRDLREALS